jgi:hypothetical protein
VEFEQRRIIEGLYYKKPLYEEEGIVKAMTSLTILNCWDIWKECNARASATMLA